ncbi:5'/3'-nucleotidase SurE [Serratia rhizosphaerae]|uniref:5'-nucleotidase n=1 Tax=Serratia rhizosphaerae TaxID=2597702 RepID=A0ABX6GKH6_9GAMM|nr:5'/3'-nucleotidase SurE [Serratia rhizosphaerae]MEB6334747.1 5'/3'-nucleotidase SurE [Serratia rhizosphaerae]QHA86784.1 5'/3'-nucleotidase SurE [Serratia rhizosphaerae]
MKTKILTAVMLGALATTAHAIEKPMKILLVNDDGCESIGTTTLQDKLTAKGYDVWLVAPATNQSGIGSAITFKPGKIFNVKKMGDKRYCFPGTPADALDFGLWGVLQNAAPDLVISGVNDGPNTGMAQVNSGTVSAAARAVRYGFPAIAASIGYRFTQQEMDNNWPSTHQYWPDAVDYVVDMVDKLNSARQAGAAVLPKGSGLSINYPPLPESEIKGVHYIGNEQYPTPQIGYQLRPDGTAQQTMNPAALEPTTADNDSGWLNKGYITYTLFSGSWNAPQFQPQYEALLGK